MAIASSRLAPHIDGDGLSRRQTSGRSGWPKIAQRLSSVSCTQRAPAGLPFGMPGIGEEIDGAMQQAPQPARHSIVNFRRSEAVARGAAHRRQQPYPARAGAR